MARYTRARGRSEVHADVHTVGRVRALDRAYRATGCGHELTGLVVTQVFELGDVPARRDEQMARAVGVEIHHRHGVRGAFEHQCLDREHRFIRERAQRAEGAVVDVLPGDLRHVTRAPTRPQPIETHWSGRYLFSA